MPDASQSPDRIEKLARRSWWAALVGAGGLLVFVLSLGFGTYYLDQVSDRVEVLHDSIASLEAEKEVKLAQVNQLRTREKNLSRRVDSLQALSDGLSAAFGDLSPDQMQQVVAAAEEATRSAERQPTAWIQVANEAQREEARRMGALLRQEPFGGFRVPGIETVDRLPENKQIRVFNPEDMALARTVRDALAAEGFVFTIQDLSMRYDVEPGFLEFWFASPE